MLAQQSYLFLSPPHQWGTVAEGQHTTSGTDLDVQGSDAELLAAGSDVLGSQHGGIRRGLVTVGLDLHTTGNTADGFAATGITQNVSLRCFISVMRLRDRPALLSLCESALILGESPKLNWFFFFFNG